MKTRKSVIITDPCYIVKKNDWLNCLVYDSPRGIVCDLSTIGFKDFITGNTIYGDWSCTLYRISNQLKYKHISELKGSFNGKESKDYRKVGEFCADAGLVCVVNTNDVLKYNPRFFEDYAQHTYTLVPTVSAKYIEWSYEIETNDCDGNIDHKEAHIVGRDEEGYIRFISMQTGL